MRSKNPKLKADILEYINIFYRKNSRTPTSYEIGAYLNVSNVTAYRYLVEMNEDGMLKYNNGVISTDVIDKCSMGEFSAPVVGSVTCGDPTAEEENIEEYIKLPESIFGKGDFYVLRAKGDSMVDAGINEGDLVVVEKTINCIPGNIVVALDDSNENTLKRFDGFKNGKPILSYMNENVYPGKTVDVESFSCQGIARHIIKSI